MIRLSASLHANKFLWEPLFFFTVSYLSLLVDSRPQFLRASAETLQNVKIPPHNISFLISALLPITARTPFNIRPLPRLYPSCQIFISIPSIKPQKIGCKVAQASSEHADPPAETSTKALYISRCDGDDLT